MPDIFDKLQPIVQRYQEIETLMAQPDVAADYSRLQELNRERSSMEDFVGIDAQHRKLGDEQSDLRALVHEGGDADFLAMAQSELAEVESSLAALSEQLKLALLPRDPNDDRDVIVEIHSAAGGQEASLFAGDLYRMYQRYAQVLGWAVEILDSNPSDLGGFKPNCLLGRRPTRLQPAQVRGRRPPGATGTRNGNPGSHPHFNGNRRRASTGG